MNGLKILALLGLVAAGTSAFGDVISLRADNWCPFNCPPNDAHPGYMIEIAKEAFAVKGHTIDYKILNWTRAVEEARKGVHSGVVGANKSDVPDFIFPNLSLGTQKNCFFTKKDNQWTFKGVDSLASVKVAVIAAYTYSDKINKYIADHPNATESVSGDDALEQNINKVLNGRLAALVEESSVINNHLMKSGKVGALREAGCDNSVDLYIAFSPKNKKSNEYAKILGEHLEVIRKNGHLKDILAPYGLSDWK